VGGGGWGGVAGSRAGSEARGPASGFAVGDGLLLALRAPKMPENLP